MTKFDYVKFGNEAVLSNPAYKQCVAEIPQACKTLSPPDKPMSFSMMTDGYVMKPVSCEDFFELQCQDKSGFDLANRDPKIANFVMFMVACDMKDGFGDEFVKDSDLKSLDTNNSGRLDDDEIIQVTKAYLQSARAAMDPNPETQRLYANDVRLSLQAYCPDFYKAVFPAGF